jgi:predicted glutamine amidotransferase
MCIIVYKPAGVSLPSDDILYNCFINNPDGAGLMFPKGNEVVIRKGFMSYNALIEDINTVQNEMHSSLKTLEMVLHFRHATHGNICPQNCHPFPCVSNIKDLKKLNISTSIGIAHNGIIDFCTAHSYSSYKQKQSKISDTQVFVRDYLSKLTDKELFNSVIQGLIFEATNSKFAVMTAKKTELIGSFIKHRGVFYSNSSYEYSFCWEESAFDFCAACGEFERVKYFNGMWLCESCIEYFD